MNDVRMDCVSRSFAPRVSTMPDWGDLPRELLQSIADRLDSPFYITRFRSVCNCWRSSVPAGPRNSPSRFPILPNVGILNATGGFYLCKRTIFRFGFPGYLHPGSRNGWLIKVEEVASRRMNMFQPLSGAKYLTDVFPITLDISDIQISELCHEYVLSFVNSHPFGRYLGDSDNLYMEKVVLASKEDGSYVVLTIHVSGKLVVLRPGDENWCVIDDLTSPYDDVIFINGRFYAVDSTGRAVSVEIEPYPGVSLIAGSVFGGDKKYLVESEGQLLLVDIYLSVGPANDLNADEESEEPFEDSPYERAVRLKVYALNAGKGEWVEVTNLGDRILFLGDNCAFSALASDFSWCRVNCIYFSGNYSCQGIGISVFCLESGEFLSAEEGYWELFWPPPGWVINTKPLSNAKANQHGLA